MSDQFEKVEPPVAPPAETPPAPPPEPVDETGVPYRNRVAELNRKLQESAERERAYQIALGQQQPQRPTTPAPVTDDLAEIEKQFDEPTRKYVRGVAQKIAEDIAQRTGYRMMTQATHQTVLQDQALLQEANKVYQALKQNPLWASVDDTLVQDRAIAEARATIATRAPAVPATPAQPVRQTAPGSVPQTSSAPPPPAQSDKAKWIAEYKIQPETLETFRRFYRGVDPASDEGKKILDEVAEEAWTGTKFTGAVASAYRAMQSGSSQAVLPNVQEVR